MRKAYVIGLPAGLAVAAAATLSLLYSGQVFASKNGDKDKDSHPTFPRTTEVLQLYCGIDPAINQHVVLAATSGCEGDPVLCGYTPQPALQTPCAQAVARALHIGFEIEHAQADEFAFDVHYTLIRIRKASHDD